MLWVDGDRPSDGKLGWAECQSFYFFPRKFGESCTRVRRQEREEGAEGVFYNMPSGGRGGGSEGNVRIIF